MSLTNTWKPKSAKSKLELVEFVNEVSGLSVLPEKQEISVRFKNEVKNKGLKRRLQEIQKTLNFLEYNFTDQQFYSCNKNLGNRYINSVAKKIIAKSLPIRCVEAVFLSIYLTSKEKLLINSDEKVNRFPVHFQSKYNLKTHRHIVLFIEYQNIWGTLGLSRKKELMYKPFNLPSLSGLIQEFVSCYKSLHHEVELIAIGQILSHENLDTDRINWRKVAVSPADPNFLNTLDVYAERAQLVERKLNLAKLFHIKPRRKT
eukprot:snap_masked-scaffold_8-processed-gene-6.48-mRNA-1 protein AED:1.00 eAED:1.00 QI:0/-1/0/0/-1/1/1/0/258